MVHREPSIRQHRAHSGGVAGVGSITTTSIASPNSGLRWAGQLRTAALVRPSTCPNSLIADQIDELGLPRVGPPPSDRAVRTDTVGQPTWPAEPGLVHPEHPDGLRLAELPPRVVHQRPLHHRPRHPVRSRHLRLVRPSSTARARLSRNRVVVRIPAGTCTTASVNVCCVHYSARHRQRRLRHCNATAVPPQGQVLGAGQHPFLARGRHHPTARTPGRVWITGHQLHNLDPTRGENDTLHRQPIQSQQHVATSLRSTTARGSPLAAPKTQRGSSSHGPPSFRRAGPSCPVKIGEPISLLARPQRSYMPPRGLMELDVAGVRALDGSRRIAVGRAPCSHNAV